MHNALRHQMLRAPRHESRTFTAARLGALLLATGVLASPAAAQTRDPRLIVQKRNILLLVADDVGIDKTEPYVHYYNNNALATDNVGGVSTVPRTPTIRALSEAGVMFLNAWGCPTCSPSRASMFTGTHPSRHGVYNPKMSDNFTEGRSGGHTPTTIAQVLGDAGYETALFGKWHLGSSTTEGPVDNGWDEHKGFLAGEIEDYYAWTKTESDASGDTTATLPWHVDNYSSTVNVNDAADWIASRTGPWMATVAFNAVHWVHQDIDGDGDLDETLKYQSPPSGCAFHASGSTDENAIYRATVECMDTRIADLLAAIGSQTLQKTTIIFIGDNGTDDDRTAHFALKHGKGSLYEGGINVPFIVADGYTYANAGAQSPVTSGTGRIVSPRRMSTALVQGVDLYATIADIAGADKSCGVDAVSLIPLLNGSATSVRDTCLAQSSVTDWAARSTTYKYICTTDTTSGVMTQKLYNLLTDRWEATDLLTDGGTSTFEAYLVAQLTARKNAIIAVSDCYP